MIDIPISIILGFIVSVIGGLIAEFLWHYFCVL